MRRRFLAIWLLFGWSTLAQIVEASAEQRAAAVEQLAAQTAPALRCTRSQERAAGIGRGNRLCRIALRVSSGDADRGVAAATKNEAIRESFRTLQSNALSKPAPVFSFVEVADEGGGHGGTDRLRAFVRGERG